MSTPAWLLALGIPDDCISNSSSAGEKGRRFSIRPQRGERGDIIWCVRMDGCWLQEDTKKVDYLFWGQSSSGRRLILLVELKGQDFGKALEQIESTLQLLCKRSEENRIHTGGYRGSPGHDLVKAYVVLSRGKGVPQRQKERERIRERYGVIVYPKEKGFEIDGLDAIAQ